MKKKNRKIALVVDNRPAHPQIPGLQSVELVFLPPNTTSENQPMDQVIIKNLKVHYRERDLLRYIVDIGQSKAPHISLLDAIHMLSQAWNCVTPQTITNCFRHAGISTDNASPTSKDR
uniref:Tigger transposable element-derived protein 4-like n=1 Tax=Crassostrea virginica TaxID=6565 RepID=A0A8B8AUB2_CRAVI|nr:tigger transposable element-derived protein 4-like [Crassostrea virginica]